MARTRTPEAPLKVPSGFVASAVRLPTSSRNMAGRPEGWQNQAWNFWETTGELRYVAQWTGNVLSRANLVPAKREGRMLVPIMDAKDPATEAMEALYGGPQGQAQMLQLFGIHTTVAGEVYIVNRAARDDWNCLAAGKVTQLGNGASGTVRLQADFGTEGGPESLSPQDLVIRTWTPHPRDPTRPDSPVRANLNTLGQIRSYDAHINAQVRSRLAGNGILFLSNEVDFPVPAGADPAASPATHFMKMLAEAMMTPIENPEDPSALVPIVAMVPTDSLGKNEWIKFWTDLDEKVVEMRDAAIKRLALGLDVPPEVLLGVADANHWNAWLSEESAVKAHLEPKLAIIAYALTEQYLQPALKGLVPDAEDYFVIADTSGIRLRPNRSQEAIELYDRGELSGIALRRETGFQQEDAPGDEQVRIWLLRKIATGSTSPEQTQAALHLLGADLGLLPDSGANRPPPDDQRTDVTPELPNRNPPSRRRAEERATREQSSLAAACDVLVYRALERAGNRLRNAHPRTDTTKMAPTDVYKHLAGDPDHLLAGAWDCAFAVLEPYTDDADGVIATLDFYVRGLLGSHRDHSQVVMAALIGSRPVALAPVE
ncbi:MAG: hypothetical protein EHM24_00030 [Acidobacteria bacterium]|nr:MAG: hypothetical protein EHM24_00030 [Acidobacteriota bacterium]